MVVDKKSTLKHLQWAAVFDTSDYCWSSQSVMLFSYHLCHDGFCNQYLLSSVFHEKLHSAFEKDALNLFMLLLFLIWSTRRAMHPHTMSPTLRKPPPARHTAPGQPGWCKLTKPASLRTLGFPRGFPTQFMTHCSSCTQQRPKALEEESRQRSRAQREAPSDRYKRRRFSLPTAQARWSLPWHKHHAWPLPPPSLSTRNPPGEPHPRPDPLPFPGEGPGQLQPPGARAGRAGPLPADRSLHWSCFQLEAGALPPPLAPEGTARPGAGSRARFHDGKAAPAAPVTAVTHCVTSLPGPSPPVCGSLPSRCALAGDSTIPTGQSHLPPRRAGERATSSQRPRRLGPGSAHAPRGAPTAAGGGAGSMSAAPRPLPGRWRRGERRWRRAPALRWGGGSPGCGPLGASGVRPAGGSPPPPPPPPPWWGEAPWRRVTAGGGACSRRSWLR